MTTWIEEHAEELHYWNMNCYAEHEERCYEDETCPFLDVCHEMFDVTKMDKEE